MDVFYKPDDAWAADFIPFFHEGAYHLFYLKDWRDKERHGEGTPWWHVVTRDIVTFEDWGEALPRGKKDEQDLFVFTGSVVAADDGFHIFYTGHNPHLRDAGKPLEGVMRATSPDLRTWTKRAGELFLSPGVSYEMNDWRDPLVFRNDEAGEWWMLLAARWKEGRPSRNRGLTALAASRDLVHWESRGPFWAPDLYYTHECPDLFRMGDWWYLVFSEFTGTFRTRYRMSRSLAGPWLAPGDDLFDDRAYYAAKTAGDDEHRYIFGWLPSRDGEKDTGSWNWGGHLAVHEITQRTDGSLSVRAPETLLGSFPRECPIAPAPILGGWRTTEECCRVDASDRFSVIGLGELPKACLVEAEITFESPTASFGFLLRANEPLDRYYELRFEPARGRMVFDRWPRAWDNAFIVERPLPLVSGKPVRIAIVVDDSAVVAYADDRVALSCRMYDDRSGALALFVSEGRARFDKIRIRTRG